jgi:hypothetical protein
LIADVDKAVDTNKTATCVFMDPQKAFDLVDHKILQQVLEATENNSSKSMAESLQGLTSAAALFKDRALAHCFS